MSGLQGMGDSVGTKYSQKGCDRWGCKNTGYLLRKHARSAQWDVIEPDGKVVAQCTSFGAGVSALKLLTGAAATC